MNRYAPPCGLRMLPDLLNKKGPPPLEEALIISTAQGLISAVAVVVVPALETTTAFVATAAVAAIFAGLSYGNTNGPAVYRSTVQFLDSFLGRLVIGHFNECKSAGFAGEFVHNDFSGRNLAILSKIIL